MTATEYIVLVNESNQEIGTIEKLAAHTQNQLHRAFSVFIFRRSPRLEILLQQRAQEKYHCGGLWTNTCCSHPHPGESILAAGKRRLQQELGFSAELTDLGWFHYNAHFSNGLSENEIDHVLIGEVDHLLTPVPAEDEVAAYRWIAITDLEAELAKHPEHFTPWLKPALAIAKTKIPT